MWIPRAFTFALLSLAALPAAADPSNTFLQMNYVSGDIDGFVQTPSGGRRGTTTAQRPELDELGMHDVGRVEYLLSNENRFGHFYLGYDQSQMSNKLRLERDLVSQATYLSSGEEVTADVKLDLFRLGYGRRFHREISGKSLLFYPCVELAALDFHYKVVRTTEPAHKASVPEGLVAEEMPEVRYGDINRSYTKTGIRLGARAEYLFGRRLALTARFLNSLDIENQPQVRTASLGLRYRVSESEQEASYLHFQLGREVLDYRDEQPLPNHIRAEYKNLASIGLSASI